MALASSNSIEADSAQAENVKRIERAQSLQEAICRALDRRFDIVCGNEGELLTAGENPAGFKSTNYADMIFAACQAGRPELIAVEEPLAVLAAPLGKFKGEPYCAVGVFLIQDVTDLDSLRAAAERLQLDSHATLGWASSETVWRDHSVLKTAKLMAQFASMTEETVTLRDELDDVSSHLLSTYEEITLVHRLTQHLRLSRTEEELGLVALRWLADVVAADGLAIYRHTTEFDESDPTQPGKLQSLGRFPIEMWQVDDFMAHLGERAKNEPMVVNRDVTSRSDWKYPQIREVVSVPVEDSGKVIGRLVAVNHQRGEEFGTVEASLLAAVGAILGIHGGNLQLYREQAEFLASVVRALTSAIDAKDPYTCGHSDRVARVAVRLAQELGLDQKAQETVYLSGLLHDIGKIGIDDSVLRKTGRLTAEEYEHIKLHPELGYKILRDLKQLGDVLPAVLHHHEAWDGSGYPHKLAGDTIPLLARIVAVADSFDAMSSDRPYRQGMAYSYLDEILRSGAGKQWDANVVEAYFSAHNDILSIADGDREKTRSTEEMPAE